MSRTIPKNPQSKKHNFLGSNSMYKSTIDSMADAIHVIDKDFKIIIFNKKFKNFNRKIKLQIDVIGKSIFDVFPFLSKDILEEYKKVFETGKLLITEESNIINKKEYFTETRKIPVMEKGKAINIITVVRDITERKKQEKELVLNNMAVESSVAAFAVADIKGGIISVNKAFLKTWGYRSKKHVLGKPVSQFWLMEKQVFYVLGQLKKNKSYFGELQARKKDGSSFVAKVSASIIRDKQDNPIAMMAYFMDVTKENQTKESLINSEAKYRLVMENMHDLVFQVSPLGFIQYISPKVKDFYGYTPKELIGKHIKQTTVLSQLPKALLVLKRVLSGENIRDFEIRLKNKQGKPTVMEVNIFPVVSNGRIIAVQGVMRDVTNIRRIQLTVRKNEQLLKAIVNSSPNCVYVKDDKDRFILVNKKMTSLFSLRAEDFINKTVKQVFASFDKKPGYAFKKIFEGDKDVIISKKIKVVPEENLVCPDGSKICYRLNKIPLDTADYRNCVLGIAIDLTDYKKAIEQVRLLKERIEFILGATNTGLDIIDSNFNIVYIDPIWASKYGKSVGRKCYEYFMKRNEPCLDCGIIKAKRTNKPVVSDEVLVREKNRLVQITTIPFKGKTGNSLFAEVNVDITERKKAEEKIADTERRLVDFYESSRDAYVFVDMKGNIKEFNKAYKDMLGYTDSELVKLTYKKLTPKKWHAMEEEIVKTQILKHGFSELYEKEYVRSNGSVIPVELRTCLVKDVFGKPEGMWAFIRDISIRKETENNLKQVYQRLKVTQDNLILSEKLAALGKFSLGIAHEVKNPLGIALGGVEFLNQKLADKDEELVLTVAKIKDALMRANKILYSLLQTARPTKMNIVESDINELIDDVLSLVQFKIDPQRITIEKDFVLGCVNAKVDKSQIHQVMFNVFMNAIEAMPKKGKLLVKTYIKELKENKKQCVIEVIDTGKGIEKDNLSKLFEPFFSTKDKDKGLGLGLIIVKDIIDRHKGTFSIKSQPKKGACAVITLPMD
ncbi:MAG: PAS domain S-box protein [Candidatus Gygaella obscura]|nr:PAS domain S-box protein [Candidatus Gygaella obscura]